MTSRPVRVRMAPSPTGYFHLGSARTALFNWLYARHTGGAFILRIEDTDRTRLVPDSLQDIMDSLRWLDLDWDEGPEAGGRHGPYFQSQRLPLYHGWAERLVQQGHAYRCYCSEERLAALRQEQLARKAPVIGYDRQCRSLTTAQRAEREATAAAHVIRFAMPTEGETRFVDLLRKIKPFDNDHYRDPIIIKSDGFPTYHFANVIDDHFMEITHILRGDEWLSSVPLHVNLYNALGWEVPVFAHLPLILDPSGVGKLSKRKKRGEGDEELLTYIREYRAAGYLPEAMFNFLAIMGWSYSPNTDVFDREQAIAKFDIADINAAAGALPMTKLNWMNGLYIRELEPADLAERLLPFLGAAVDMADDELRNHAALPLLVPMMQSRLVTLNDAGELVDFVFAQEIRYDPQMLIAKGLDAAGSLTALAAARQLLAELPFEESALEQPMRDLADRLGLKPGQLFGILRVAITGKNVAPPLFSSMIALGRDRALARCARAEELLRGVMG
ncbi:MAG: glutamate--tRNA ligase [Chloroflexi bacterium]|nr:glutamate--tRNA ligase [Chloroflexota bacterium]